MYGCVQGLNFLIDNNIKVNRLTTNKIFIDNNGVVKIMDQYSPKSSETVR